jgi:hypothetical protein
MNQRRTSAWQRREVLVSQLLTGSTVADAATAIGVRPETASRMLAEPDVRAMLAEQRAAIAEQTRDAVAAIHKRAIQIVRDELSKRSDTDLALSVLRLTLPSAVRSWPDQPGADVGTVTLVGVEAVTVAMRAIEAAREARS